MIWQQKDKNSKVRSEVGIDKIELKDFHSINAPYFQLNLLGTKMKKKIF